MNVVWTIINEMHDLAMRWIENFASLFLEHGTMILNRLLSLQIAQKAVSRVMFCGLVMMANSSVSAREHLPSMTI